MSSVNQAAYVAGTTTYQFGHNSIPNIPITGEPADSNLARWSMLYDGSAYRMYFFKGSSANSIYQCAFNGSSYQYGHNSIPELQITGAPADADSSSFSMLHDGSTYRLYLRRLGYPDVLYQFGFNGSTYQYGHNSIPTILVTNAPADTDWNRWAMLHDGSAYRLYAFQLGSNDHFYQASFNGETYQFGHNSIPELTLTGTPANSNTASMSMLYDGSNYRFYFQTR